MISSKSFPNTFDNFAAAKSWLEENASDYFTKIEVDGLNHLLLYINDNDLFVDLDPNSGNTRVYINETDYAQTNPSDSSTVTLHFAMRCNNGIYLYIRSINPRSGSNYCTNIIFTKSNDGNTVCIITPKHNAPTSNLNSDIHNSTSYYCLMWGNKYPCVVQQFVTNPNPQYQTQLSQFLTNTGVGDGTSYTPNAFYIPISQFDRNIGPSVITFDGVDYFTNGYWAIKDE